MPFSQAENRPLKLQKGKQALFQCLLSPGFPCEVQTCPPLIIRRVQQKC